MQRIKTSLIAGLAIMAVLGATSSDGGAQSAGSGGAAAPSGDMPKLLGSWSGQNHTISDKKGLLTRERTVHITEQTDRRFRGYFVYAEGRKDFFGVIYPDNTSFTWVASDSKGYNHGRILGPDRISACYVEPGAEATAGCADLARVKK